MTEEQVEQLRLCGWSQWYNLDYWVHPKWCPIDCDYTNYGLTTEQAYDAMQLSLISDYQEALATGDYNIASSSFLLFDFKKKYLTDDQNKN